uniref:transformer-2 protein homolog alpha-like n=1 Tax=Myxine glutinosa TaxID=7769 RepID=UPI00358E3333
MSEVEDCVRFQTRGSLSRSQSRTPPNPQSGSRSYSYSRSKSRSHSRTRSDRRRSRSHSRGRHHRRSRSYTPERRDRRSRSHSPPYGFRQRRHHGDRERLMGKQGRTGCGRNVKGKNEETEKERRKQMNPEPNECLGIFGLSYNTTVQDLREIFTRYGPLSDVSVVLDQQTGRPRGFAFVSFENIDDARDAKEQANGMEVDGRNIRVDFSITKRPHTPTPGIYMGRPSLRQSPNYYRESGRYRSRSRSRSYSPRRY